MEMLRLRPGSDSLGRSGKYFSDRDGERRLAVTFVPSSLQLTQAF